MSAISMIFLAAACIAAGALGYSANQMARGKLSWYHPRILTELLLFVIFLITYLSLR